MRGLQSKSRGLYVMKLLIGRKPVKEMMALTCKEYGCSTAAFWRYYRIAKDEYSKGLEIDRVEEIGKAVHDLEYLYTRSLEGDDIRTALAVLKEMNTLKGLYTSQSLSVELKNDEAIAKMKTMIGGKEWVAR